MGGAHAAARWTLAATLILAVLVVVALWPSVPIAPSSSGDLTTARTSAPTTLPTPIQHVFLIMMENEGVEQVVGSGGVPYQTYLANTYAWGGDALKNGGVGYYSICHPSTGNYIGLTSGLPLHCGS
ncbi:MAG: hypothetical protein WA691_07745, partial [Thermoplasmata archaeon]